MSIVCRSGSSGVSLVGRLDIGRSGVLGLPGGWVLGLIDCRSGLAELLCCQLKVAKLTVCNSGMTGVSFSGAVTVTVDSLAVTGVSGRLAGRAEDFFLLGNPGVMSTSTVSRVDMLDMLLMLDKSVCLVSLELSLRTGEAAYIESSWM